MKNNEDFYTSRFKPFRNKLAKYDASQIVSRGISSLHNSFSNNAFVWLRKPGSSDKPVPYPWDVLLLIKWAFIYGGNKLCFDVTHNDFINFCNQINDFQNRIRGFDEDEQSKLYKFIRTIAFQQFWLQRDFMNKYDFGRQLVLFTQNIDRYPYGQKFFEHTGVQINEFLELSFGLMTLFYKDKPTHCAQSNFSVLKRGYSAETINNFFKCLSLDFDQTKNFLAERGQQIRSPEYQLTEPSPLKQYPLLKLGEKYFPYFLPLLYSSISDFIYDVLKKNNPSDFSESFGETFQSYIKKGLEFLRTDFCDDRVLVSAYGETKQVDFVLLENNCTVLIESKAIEMSPLARVNPTNIVLNNLFQDSVLKAFKQIYSTAHSIVADPEKIAAKNTSQIFALIVTFKDLFLVDGNRAWAEFAQEEIMSFLKDESIDPNVLPPCNIFFITIDEFDWLITILKKGDVSLSEILTKAIKDNSDAKTSKYTFQQHIAGYSGKDTAPPYVEKAANKIFNNVIKQARD